MSRIAPAEPPYEPSIATGLARIMPPGVPPLLLFRTLARNPRVFGRVFAGGLLDRGALSLRQRELVIDRTTARLGCEYEWGIHVALFADRAGFGTTEIAATVHGPRDAACWNVTEKTLLAVVDDLVDCRTVATPTWEEAVRHLDEAQILEAIALVGFYHAISFFCRSLELPPEKYAARFPARPE